MTRSPPSPQHAFPCNQCGAQLAYEPGTEELACGHCGHRHRITLSTDPVHEYDFHSTLNELPGSAPDVVQMTVKCHACAAEFEFDSNLHADECPFCGVRIVVESQRHRIIQPESLLPFHIDEKEATAAYTNWLKGLWFAPGKLKKYARRERGLNGIYAPYWTYDCDTFTRYAGQRGDIYYVTRQVPVVVNGRRTMRTQKVPKIRWSPAAGNVSRDFNDVLVYASDTLPRAMTRELAPWDLGELQPYQEEFISGFQSEIYSLELDQGFEVCKQRIHPQILQDIRRDIGGDQQRISQVDTRYSDIRFKHVLLPFWIAGFRFRNKTYRFIVNGRSGEVQGDRPWSVFKITLAVIAALAVILVFMYYAEA